MLDRDVDDPMLAQRCVDQEPGAWDLLVARFEGPARMVTARVLDERRDTFDLVELGPLVEKVWGRLRRRDAAALQLWRGQRLLPYLCLLTRLEVERAVTDQTPAVSLVAPLPTPVSISRDTVAEPVTLRVIDSLRRLPPRNTVLIRLRQHGLGLEEIALTVGSPEHAVEEELQRIAGHLAKRLDDDAETWRVTLDCADIAEAVQVAIRTEEDGAYRRRRTRAETIWRQLGHALRGANLGALPASQGGPLQDPAAVARFVDGSMKGSERTQAEGHLMGDGQVVDQVAALLTDLGAVEWLRRGSHLPEALSLAAGSIGAGRFRLATKVLAAARREEAAPKSERAMALLGRLARVGLSLQRGEGRAATLPEKEALPHDDEAPLVAFEALIHQDPETARHAIDDYAVKQTIGRRLRLLASGSGADLAEARADAERIVRWTSPDPGVLEDAWAVLALPQGRALPWEIATARLRDALADAVRFLLSR